MKLFKIIRLIFCLLISSLDLFSQEVPKQDSLFLPDHLEISYLVQNSDGKILASQNSQKMVPSASVIKIPILIKLMEEVENGHLQLDEVYSLMASDKVGGSGEIQHQPDGTKLPYRLLAEEMIRISDNTATNILIRKIGMDSIQEWLTSNGFSDTRLQRIMMDFEAIEKGRQNYTSSMEINRILLGLLNEDWLTETSNTEILDLLKGCADRSTIPALLPSEIEVAHKTGTLENVRGDAGIIFGKNPLVLSIFVENFQSLEEAEQAIGKIALLAYEEWGN